MPSAPYYKQNRLKQLRAFCYAARANSISRAAEQLFLSQPSISLQIQALERELEAVLFERRGPTIRLTSQGAALLEIASPLLEGVDHLSEAFAARLGELNTGEINIAAGESTLLYLLPKYVKKFATTYPGVRIKLHNVTGRAGLAMLRADEADFAVGSMIEVPNDISYLPIHEFETVLIAPKGHPLAKKSAKKLTLADISPYSLILPPRQLYTWRMVEMVFNQHKLPYKVTLEAGGWEVIKKYVELGLGISVVTDICLTGREKIVRISLPAYFPTRSYGIVMRQKTYLTAPAQTFIDMVASGFSAKNNA